MRTFDPHGANIQSRAADLFGPAGSDGLTGWPVRMYTPSVTDSTAAPLTTAGVAAVLGVSTQNLRRWIREGKFDDLEGLEWDRRPGFQRQRLYSRGWILEAADLLGVEADWAKADRG